MGDDSYGVVVGDDTQYYLEIDYSHYDQSQKDMQVKAESVIMERLGIPWHIVKYMADLSARPSAFRRGKDSTCLKVKLKAPYCKRQSGSPHTSLANSINNMLAILMLARFDWDEAKAWPLIGFKAKSQAHPRPELGTFLRGMFWPLENPTRIDGIMVHHKWSWMPSAVCKMGKIQRQLTPKETIEGMARGMAMNISTTDCDVPILGAFRRALVRCSQGVRNQLPTVENFRPTMTSRLRINRRVALGLMACRYGVGTSEVENIERAYNSIKKLPGFVQTPALQKIVARDYA